MSFSTITDNTLAKKAMYGKGTNDNIQLDEICLRYKNKYINSYENAKSIKESIAKDGLIEPITLNDIAAYLTCSDNELIPSDARKYYEEMLNRGFKYFITTGHRRFFAYCSLATGEDIHTGDDMNGFYEEIKKAIEDNKYALEEGRYNDINKYTSIKAFIVKDNVKEERERYNVANLEQRITKDFEIIDNMIDEMKEDGAWDKCIEENKNNRIAKMSDRTVIDNLKRFNLASDIKTPEEARAKLYEIDASQIAGYYSDLNESISKYINDKRHKNISVKSIDKARKILDTLDPRLIEYIYSGRLEYNKAKELITFYDKIDKSEIDDVCEKIKNRQFDYSKEKAKYTNKEIKRKVPMSEKDLINLLKDVYFKKISIEDAKKKLESLNLW